MAIQAYIQIKANGSELEGSSMDTTNHDKWCDVHAFSIGATVAREAGSGRTTGRRQQAPLVIVKPLDKASPLLYQALAENHVIELKMQLYRDKPEGGGREHYYTIEMKKGRINEIKQHAPMDTNQVTNMSALEEVSIVCEESTVTWEDGGITFSENWYRSNT